MAPPSPITRPLYRSLLRTARNFRRDPVLYALLHRTGRVDKWDPTVDGPYYHRYHHYSSPPSDGGLGGRTGGGGGGGGGGADDVSPEELRSVHLPPENAMDLTRGYDELRRVHYHRTRAAGRSGGAVGGRAASGGGSGGLVEEIVPSSKLEEYVMAKFREEEEEEGGKQGNPAHEVLCRRLLRDVIGGPNGGEAQMLFPAQIIADDGPGLGRLEDVIRREFRAPSLGTWDGAGTSATAADAEDPLPVSSYFDDDVRREAGFLALRELGKKLSWAESLGMELGGKSKSVGTTTTTDTTTAGSAVREDEDEDGAAGRHEATAPPPPQEEEEKSTTQGGSSSSSPVQTRHQRHQQHPHQAARNVTPLPTTPPSSYLRPGSYLVAHPLLPGYFARSVIAILEHTDKGPTKGDHDDDNATGESGSTTDSNSVTTGGTYGLIINRESYASLPGGYGDRRRPRALREVVRPDCLPETLRRAFGDLAVREGGPVHAAVQMMHASSPEGEERLRLGGTILPMILEEEEKEKGGGVCGGGVGDGGGHGGEKGVEEGGAAAATTEVVRSAALDTDTAIYFNGDLMKAARAVLDGDMDRDDFSFVIGASVWTAGQLESEIERGFWLPCRGPPHMALTGMCEHVDGGGGRAAGGGGGDDGKKRGSGSSDNKHGKAPPRPKSDLWLSMMCAIGEEEARLAHLMLDEEYDENGEACDDF